MEHFARVARVARHRLLPLLPRLLVTLAALYTLRSFEPSAAATPPIGLHAACFAMPVPTMPAPAAELGQLEPEPVARVALFATAITLDFAPNAARDLQLEIERDNPLPHRAQTPLARDVLELGSRARSVRTANDPIDPVKGRLPNEVREGSSGHIPLSLRPITSAEHRTAIAHGIPRIAARVTVI